MESPGILYSLASPGEMSLLAAGAGGWHSLLGTQADLAGRYRHDDDAAAFLASRTLLQLLAAHLLGVPAQQAAGLEVGRCCRSCGSTDHGKPRIAGLEVSLSRTRTLVLAAAAPAGTRLGADVELVPEAVFEGFDQTVLSPAEQRRAGGGPAGRRQRMLLWTAKEAALKATGHGLAVEPSLLSVEDDAGTGRSAAVPFRARIRCPDPGELDGLRVGWVPAGDRHLAALACSDPLPVRAIAPSRLLGPCRGNQPSG
ncbi:4'-phosphopantetheinyl transferase family protein [Arthrobacter sp. GCM10027362]|uniref:4'-phosphopantetheinyl transferase family protein n=1 Tax=Arthrobacter sp. GCM10027362 TaxID=3273379 RepID=UPI00362500F8